jgi:hypothetical protein
MRSVGVLALALLLSTSLARADAVRLAVVELTTPQNLSGIGLKLTQDIIAAAAREPNTRVLQPAEVERALGPEGMKRLNDCFGRPACVAQAAAALPADRIVVGSLDRNESSYLVNLYLVDLKARSVISSVERAIIIASRRLQADVSAAIPGLLAGRAEAKGKLDISSTRPGATISFDGEVVGKTPMTVEAKPGKHTLKITKQGYLDVERYVVVAENTTEPVALTLIGIPGAKTEEDELPAMVQKPGEEAGGGGPGITVPVVSWVAGGLAIASAGVGLYFAVDTNSLKSKAGAGPVYGITRQQALTGKTDAIVADVLFATAGVAAAAAVVFGIVLQEPAAKVEAAPKAALAPISGGAAVTLSGTF